MNYLSLPEAMGNGVNGFMCPVYVVEVSSGKPGGGTRLFITSKKATA